MQACRLLAMALDALIRRLGGVATTAELLSFGFSAEIIAAFVAHGRVLHVRQGWYSTIDVPAAARAACTVGGRLACLSALRYHGLPFAEPEQLHVAVGRSASRLRTHDGVVLHWSRRALDGDRIAVSVAEALRQAAACAALGGTAPATL